MLDGLTRSWVTTEKKMSTRKKSERHGGSYHAAILGTVVAAACAGFAAQPGYAGSSTWSATAASTNWLDPTNWSPQTVPNATIDTATFGVSIQTTVNDT